MGNGQGRRRPESSTMGAGGSASANNQTNNPGGGGLFGGEPVAVRNNDELSAEQLQMLIQAGRLQYGGRGGQRGGLAENGGDAVQEPAPVFHKAKTTQNPFNLKKNSLKIVSSKRGGDASDSGSVKSSDDRYIEFYLDSTEPCVVTVWYFAREYVTKNHLTVKFDADPEFGSAASSTPQQFSYDVGLNQKVVVVGSPIPPEVMNMDASQLVYSPDTSSCYPIIIDVRSPASDGDGKFVPHDKRKAQTTFATFNESGNAIKALKQKVSVDGHAYELHDIYGISQSAGETKEGADGTGDDDDALCVICMTEDRNTAVLPCRHMCLCVDCAQALRLQSNKCPICRGPVQSLLHIKVED